MGDPDVDLVAPADADLAEVRATVARLEAAGEARLNDEQRLALAEAGGRRLTAALARRSGDAVGAAFAYDLRGTADAWLGPVTDEPWAEGLLASVLPSDRAVRWWVFGAGHAAAAERLAARLGFTPERTLVRMARRLPLPDAWEGLPTEAFRPGTDEAAWLALNNAAFADHPEQGGWSAETLASRVAQPWFRAGDLRMHWSGGRLVGSCWMKIRPGPGGTEGEIYAIAVDPSASGRGVGRRLTVAALRHAAARGATEAVLYVDADNRAALSLYRGLGFAEVDRDRSFIRRGRTGPPRR